MEWEKSQDPGISREKKFALQCLVSLIAGLMLFWGVRAPYPRAREAAQAVSGALTREDEIGNGSPLSFVSSLLPRVQEVFSPQEEKLMLRAPMTGETAVSEGSIAYLCSRNPVTACEAGRVFYAGDSRVYLLHDDGYQTRYQGLTPQVRAGQKVEAGEELGTADMGTTLSVTLLQDGKTLDIREYLRDGA